MGDLNYILSMYDREIGIQVQDYETKDFKSFVEDFHLLELPAIERSFT